MRIFVIDEKNAVTAYVAIGHGHIAKGSHVFASAKELARLASDWPGARLVEIWNKLPNARVVQNFADRNIAIQRIWKAVQQLAPSPRERHRTPSYHSAGTADLAGVRITKTARIIALIKRPAGATLEEIMDETDWQAHSVRGFICRLPQRFGLRIKSFKRAGEHVYQIP